MILLSEIYNNLDSEYIVILVPNYFHIDKINSLTEGIWLDSTEKGIKVRVEAAHVSDGFKHVHVARSEHTRSKNKQVSWNTNGTRHDKKRFNKNFHGFEKAKRAAKKALNLPDDVILELYTDWEKANLILKSIPNRSRNCIVLIIKDTSKKHIMYD